MPGEAPTRAAPSCADAQTVTERALSPRSGLPRAPALESLVLADMPAPSRITDDIASVLCPGLRAGAAPPPPAPPFPRLRFLSFAGNRVFHGDVMAPLLVRSGGPGAPRWDRNPSPDAQSGLEASRASAPAPHLRERRTPAPRCGRFTSGAATSPTRASTPSPTRRRAPRGRRSAPTAATASRCPRRSTSPAACATRFSSATCGRIATTCRARATSAASATPTLRRRPAPPPRCAPPGPRGRRSSTARATATRRSNGT